MTKDSETLRDCSVTYWLIDGSKTIGEYKQDLPREIWNAVYSEFNDDNECVLIDTMDSDVSNILIPKKSILYISMKITS